MPRESLTRDSDGATIDLAHEEAEQSDTTARAKRVELIDSSGDAISSSNRLPVDAELTVQDIQIGVVELKDSDSATRADIETDSTKGSLFVQSESLASETSLSKLIGFSIPEYDEIVLTYVASGNGIGEIETVVYKKTGDVIATLTLSYDANDKLSGVVKS